MVHQYNKWKSAYFIIVYHQSTAFSSCNPDISRLRTAPPAACALVRFRAPVAAHFPVPSRLPTVLATVSGKLPVYSVFPKFPLSTVNCPSTPQKTNEGQSGKSRKTINPFGRSPSYLEENRKCASRRTGGGAGSIPSRTPQVFVAVTAYRGRRVMI